MAGSSLSVRGRGAGENPPNRFESLSYDWERDETNLEVPAPGTCFFKDSTRSILSCNESPDVGFEASLNPYRGCEHGCVYCYARPTHEYLGFSAGLDFETKILVKEDAPGLLRKALSSPRWRPQVVAMSGVTDPYQPVERRLALTRRCLEVFLGFRNPVVIVTKSHLVTRDIDLLAGLARCQAAAVYLSVTTLDGRLSRIMEPRASRPARRLAAIEALARAGVPVGVLVAPVIPGLTDHEIPSIVAASARAGARFAGYVELRLPYGVGGIFERWLARHLPEAKEKVLNRVRAIRGGRLNDPRFGHRMRGSGVFAEQTAALFRVACRRAGVEGRCPALSTAAFRRPCGDQLSLFGRPA
ncbi:MAG: PA0069 family radical SAM protein [Candidatus Tectomicrobia bacterium]|nr:PA0069 family radical SAM protein [Candidatus Tectomicrobia bacterium]